MRGRRTRHSQFLLLDFATLSLAPLLVSAALLAQSPTPQFTVGVEYVEVEARVLDDDGQPVRGLTKDTFQVLEDGVAQDVTAFVEIDRPAPPAMQSGLSAGLKPAELVPPDVASNAPAQTEGRIYLILLDEAFISPTRTPEVRRTLRQFVERGIGPGDLAAVSSTTRSLAFQNFTSDKAMLVAAVDKLLGDKAPSPTIQSLTSLESRAAMSPSGGGGVAPSPPVAANDVRLAQGKATHEGLLRIVAWMSEMKARSRSIILVSEGLTLDSVNTQQTEFSNLENLSSTTDVEKLSEAVRLSSIPIYTVDPRGLTSFAEESILVGAVPGLSNTTPTAGLQAELEASRNGLRRLAEETGGYAALAVNDFRGAFDRIVRQASSYYVLGYYSTNDRRDGKFRKIQVKIDRPGAHVIARNGYTAASSRAPRRVSSPGPAAASEAVRLALSNRLPLSGLPLSAMAAPFRGRGSTASVAVVLESSGVDLMLTERNGTFAGPLQVLVAALDQHGAVTASEVKGLQFNLSRDVFDRVQQFGFRWLSRVNLKPGRYQIRVAAANESGKQGSVWYDLEVPNLSDGELALSGLLVASASASRAPTVRPDPLLDGILPGPPTTSRTFPTGDELTVFGELYDNRPSDRRGVEVTVRVRAESGREVFRQSDTVTNDQLRSRQGAYRSVTRIPLQVLPGSYVLTVEAQRPGLNNEPVRRSIPFRVR